MLKKNCQNEAYVAMPMDFMRNPVFLPGGSPPAGFNGELFVNGDLKVTLKGAIEGDAADIFYALADRAKKECFIHNKVSFVMGDLLKQLNLDDSGDNYARVRKAIDALYEVSVEIKGVTDSGTTEGGWRIITSRHLRKNNRNKSDGVHSWVKLSDEILELFRAGALKLVHPIYFQLNGPLDKRLFTLISVRASDLSNWEIKTFTLRDLMPLLGQKYMNPSGVLQQLDRTLKSLEKTGVIHGFEFLKEGNRKDPIVTIRPNREYFYSQGRPVKHFLEKKEIGSKKEKPVVSSENTIVSMLMAKKVSKKVAEELSQKYSEEKIKEKIQFAEELKMGNKNIRSIPAFLVESIRNDYEAALGPEARFSKEQTDKENKKKQQLSDMKRHIKEQEPKKAVELGKSIMKRQYDVTDFSLAVEKLIAKAKQSLRQNNPDKDEMFTA